MGAQQEGGPELNGAPASPGQVEGVARVVRSIDELADVRDGEILVCGSTSPAWAAIFSKIKATVTDVGGVMSHAAIVCREYGLPAVVGTGRATSQIRTGQTIKVDGTAGVVTLVVEEYPAGDVGYCAALEALRGADEPRFGGKSASLGELLAAGISVPSGFAIAAGAGETVWDEVVARYAGARRRDAGRGALERHRRRLLRGDVRGSVRELPVGAGRGRSLRRGTQVLGERHQHRAAAYRERVGGAQTPMGVAVQWMVDAAVSGVMFTCNPVSGDPSMVAINASWGLGLAVVGGEVTPDDYLVSKVTGEIVAEHVHDKAVEYVPDAAGGGTIRLEVPAERAAAACLDSGQLAELLDLARRVQRHFGSHQDIEWAIDRAGELFVLQSRPVTAVRKPQSDPAPADALSLVMKMFGVTQK